MKSGEITRCCAPYSDFNFVSLFSFNIQEDFTLSLLNDNLVVGLRDYLTLEPLYTFIGTHNPLATINNLFDFLHGQQKEPLLRLVPAESLREIPAAAEEKILIIGDPQSFDYILATELLVELPQNAVARKRRVIETFRARYPHYQIIELNLCDSAIVSAIQQIFIQWQKKNLSTEAVAIEFAAINRCLRLVTPCGLMGLGIYLDGKMISFTINEILPDNFYMGHFGKSLPAYRGLSDLAEHETARIMLRYNCTKMNYQEDLGQ